MAALLRISVADSITAPSLLRSYSVNSDRSPGCSSSCAQTPAQARVVAMARTMRFMGILAVAVPGRNRRARRLRRQRPRDERQPDTARAVAAARRMGAQNGLVAPRNATVAMPIQYR